MAPSIQYKNWHFDSNLRHGFHLVHETPDWCAGGDTVRGAAEPGGGRGAAQETVASQPPVLAEIS